MARLYLSEALETFRTGNDLASVVLIGVAAEKIMLDIIEATQNAITDTNEKTVFQKSCAKQNIKPKFDALRNKMTGKKGLFPRPLEDVLVLHLDGIFDFIRRHRNDGGHPTGRKFEREESFALLQLFPTYCRTGYSLIDWLKGNAI